MPPSDERKTPIAYRHAKKPEWGLAVQIWENEGKRGFRFEDGTERAFPLDFCHMMEEIEGAVVIPTTAAAAAESDIKLTFDDQFALFKEQYPGGFDDPTWLNDQRGVGRKRPLKRHRDGAIAKAQEHLGKEPLGALVQARDWDGVWDAVKAVANGTDLVTKSHVNSLDDAHATEVFSTSLYDLLHTEPRTDVLFDKFCRAMASTGAKASSWPLTTVFAGLIHPVDHLCVRARVLKKQAEMLRMPGKAGSPTARGYKWALGIGRRVRDELAKRGFSPKDFLDVYDFCWLTLRPASAADLVRLAHIRLAGGSLDDHGSPDPSRADEGSNDDDGGDDNGDGGGGGDSADTKDSAGGDDDNGSNAAA